jgi:hypothetical protein
MEESSYKLYERLLRLGSDWQVVNIDVDDPHDVIHVTISYRHKGWIDKSTGEIFPIYDYRSERVWRFGQHGACYLYPLSVTAYSNCRWKNTHH